MCQTAEKKVGKTQEKAEITGGLQTPSGFRNKSLDNMQ
jgi:hypothetical protein